MSSADETFRHELRTWLAEHPPPGIAVATSPEEAEALRRWQRTVHAGGWVGIHWPVEYGGRGAPLAQVAIYNEELARAQVPDIPGRAGVTLVGPTLMAHGTEEQRMRWMPRSERIWPPRPMARRMRPERSWEPSRARSSGIHCCGPCSP